MPHGTQSTSVDAAINAIAVSDHVARSPIPRKCLRDLTRNRAATNASQQELIRTSDASSLQMAVASGWSPNPLIASGRSRKIVPIYETVSSCQQLFIRWLSRPIYSLSSGGAWRAQT
jgi:hypothetical protein